MEVLVIGEGKRPSWFERMFLAEQMHQKANHSRLIRSAQQLLEWEFVVRCTKPFTQLVVHVARLSKR
eukprot:scaffold3616_cov67-Phaeocystis_antarctica.AAC.2